MPLTTDSAALLRAICALPHDTLPRLAYADLCEEAVDDARAEFIRVQCELDGNQAVQFVDADDCRRRAGNTSPLSTAAMHTEEYQRAAYLRRRERKLLAAHAWTLQDMPCLHPWDRLVAGELPYPGNPHPKAMYRRGFVEQVRLPLATWVEYGPALVLACPLLRVDLSDREPNGPYGSGDPLWLWYEAIDPPGHEDIPAALPSVLWSLLPQDYYPDEQSATDALSAACLAWARQQAGLPPLKVK